MSFEDWLAAVLAHNGIVADPTKRLGMKLDFKHLSCVQPCLVLLQKQKCDEMNVPIFFNADVLAGPGYLDTNHDATLFKQFMTVCSENQSW